MRNRILLVCGFLALAQAAWAGEVGTGALKQRLAKVLPGFEPDHLTPSPVDGLYQVVMGTQVLYVSRDGQYLMLGDVIDLDSKVNLSERARGKLVLGEIEQVSEDEMIVIGPAEAKRTITVFTDVDCPYCARLHKDVPKLVDAGVKVRYLLFPRKGPGSSTFKRSVSVWCAKDRVKAIGVAKAGEKLKAATCDNPVTKHYRLGLRVGVRGTPTIVFDDGRVVPGYSPAAELLASLGLGPKVSSAR